MKLEIPFKLRENDGSIQVSFFENTDPVKWGFDLIGLPKESLSSIKGFPVCSAKITYAENASKDARSYKVDFTKIKDQLGYKTKWTIEKGIENIYHFLQNKNFTEEDFKNREYYRVAHIKYLLEQNKLDSNLFFKPEI